MAKRALVLGASGELGHAICRRLAAEGHEVIASGRNAAVLEKMQADGLSLGTIQADLAEPQDIVDSLLEEKFDLLVVAAGGTRFRPVLKRPPEEVIREIEASVLGISRILLAAAGSMRDRRRGRILLIGSSAQFRPAPGYAAYAAGKCFLLSFAGNLAEELRGSGVRLTYCLTSPFGSQFAARAGAKRLSRPRPADDVAVAALQASARGRFMAYADQRTRVRVAIYSILPAPVLRALAPRPEPAE